MTVTLPLSPKVGMVSLGCPKALVDSERILSQLRRDGYRLSGSYADADVRLSPSNSGPTARLNRHPGL